MKSIVKLTALMVTSFTCLSAQADNPANFPTTGTWTGSYRIVSISGPTGGLPDCGPVSTGKATLSQTALSNDGQISGTLTLDSFSNTASGMQRFANYGQGASISPAQIANSSSSYIVTLNAGSRGALLGPYSDTEINMNLSNETISTPGCSLFVAVAYQK